MSDGTQNTNPTGSSVSGNQLLTLSTDDVSSKIALTAVAEFTRYTKAVCKSNCTQTLNDVQVIISPGAQVGPVSFTQECEIDNVNCAISSLIDESVRDTLRTYKKITADTPSTELVSIGSIFGISLGMVRASKPLQLSIKDNIYQMISSNCTFETNQTIQNNYVYVGSGATTGFISFAQTSKISNVDCAIDVIAKASTYTKENSQQSPEDSSGIMSKFLALMVFILVIAIVMVIVFLVVGGGQSIKELFGFSNEIPPLDDKYYTPPEKPVVAAGTEIQRNSAPMSFI
jgi:hypothetical protein